MTSHRSRELRAGVQTFDPWSCHQLSCCWDKVDSVFLHLIAAFLKRELKLVLFTNGTWTSLIHDLTSDRFDMTSPVLTPSTGRDGHTSTSCEAATIVQDLDMRKQRPYTPQLARRVIFDHHGNVKDTAVIGRVSHVDYVPVRVLELQSAFLFNVQTIVGNRETLLWYKTMEPPLLALLIFVVLGYYFLPTRMFRIMLILNASVGVFVAVSFFQMQTFLLMFLVSRNTLPCDNIHKCAEMVQAGELKAMTYAGGPDEEFMRIYVKNVLTASKTSYALDVLKRDPKTFFVADEVTFNGLQQSDPKESLARSANRVRTSPFQTSLIPYGSPLKTELAHALNWTHELLMSVSVHAISIHHLYATFVVLIVGHSISVLVAAFEMLVVRCGIRWRSHRRRQWWI